MAWFVVVLVNVALFAASQLLASRSKSTSSGVMPSGS